ncbi:MAG: hypothetical protein AAB628_00610 [Patescibacteria group bacterium]
MNTKLVLDGKYRIQTIKTAGISKDKLSEVAEQIKEMFLWFAPGSTDEDINRRLCQHPEAFVDILTHVESGECRGFTVHYTEQFNGSWVMFRGGTIVRDRSRGLYKILLHHSISAEKQDFVVAMTQNPRVYEALRALSTRGVVYPAVGVSNPEEVKLIAQEFCKAPGLDSESMIVPGVYGSIRKDKEFKSAKDHLVEKFFAESLGDDAGFFVVVSLR